MTGLVIRPVSSSGVPAVGDAPLDHAPWRDASQTQPRKAHEPVSEPFDGSLADGRSALDQGMGPAQHRRIDR